MAILEALEGIALQGTKALLPAQALEHVSTTYCFTNEPLLQDRCYRTDLDWRTVIKVAETEDEGTLTVLARKCVEEWARNILVVH